MDDFKSYCEASVCRLVKYLDYWNNQDADDPVFKIDYERIAESELESINSQISCVHLAKSEEIPLLTFEIGPDGKFVVKKKTQDKKKDKEGEEIDHKKANTQALVVYSPSSLKLNNSSFKPKKTESEKRFLGKIEDFYGIYWKNKKLFDDFVAGIKEVECFKDEGDLADKILGLCGEDKKNPDPISLMKDLDKARTNLYDEIHKFHSKWANNYNKFSSLHTDLYNKFWDEEKEKNKFD